MQEVEHWLAKLGMSEYAERFAENRIDFTVPPDLTDQDLKDIGVVLGSAGAHRRSGKCNSEAAGERYPIAMA